MCFFTELFNAPNACFVVDTAVRKNLFWFFDVEFPFFEQFALAKAELLAEDFLTVCAPANEVTAAVPADSATLTTAVRRFTYSTRYRSNSHDSELDSAYQMFQFYC